VQLSHVHSKSLKLVSKVQMPSYPQTVAATAAVERRKFAFPNQTRHKTHFPPSEDQNNEGNSARQSCDESDRRYLMQTHTQSTINTMVEQVACMSSLASLLFLLPLQKSSLKSLCKSSVDKIRLKFNVIHIFIIPPNYSSIF
jgi:hypothetical protein